VGLAKDAQRLDCGERRVRDGVGVLHFMGVPRVSSGVGGSLQLDDGSTLPDASG
jgi:hypothetical protein